MKKTKVIILILLILGIIVWIVLALFKNKKKILDNIYQPSIESIAVNVEKALPSKLQIHLNYVGTFLANETIDMMPQTAGNVVKIYFKEGDMVKKDSLLVQIDDDVLQAQIIGAKATYENAKINYERYQNIADKSGISQSQLDQYYLNLQTAKSQYLQLEKQINNCKIIAPFSGFISDKSIDAGAYVNSSITIAKLTNISKLQLQISVPENEISYFYKGQKMKIVINSLNNLTLEATVDYVSAVADDTHNFTVKLLINNSQYKIKVGMYANVYLDKTFPKTGFILKRSALLGSVIQPQVYVVNPTDNRVNLINVELGQYNADNIEVIDGLKEGDLVVTNGQINLEEGIKVNIIK
ncbi:MAG: efflux RND transporter periplasmic adaptor subunit [Chitinophagaceae bacterium]